MSRTWTLELAHIIRTGRLARPIEDYPDVVAYLLMFKAEDLIRLQDQLIEKYAETDWERVRSTGDEVADEWEKQLARGELPDWMKEGAGGG